jgi:hypothetical protein
MVGCRVKPSYAAKHICRQICLDEKLALITYHIMIPYMIKNQLTTAITQTTAFRGSFLKWEWHKGLSNSGFTLDT